ncbi:MAG: gliding motility-associated C-terminal domain-containing protein, partial [Calditrichaeota bacterium]|nr:gliding motility-associated C-terminal domain-containing protein [Calditrichota bacterium]
WIANPYKDQFSNGSSGSLQIEISHNPFSPNGDGIDDQLGIKLNYDEFDLVKLSVYSLSGRLVRQLLNGEYAAIGEFEWDGRDESGRLQITGPYILLFSAKRKKSGEQFVKKIPVVLIR